MRLNLQELPGFTDVLDLEREGRQNSAGFSAGNGFCGIGMGLDTRRLGAVGRERPQQEAAVRAARG